MSDTTREAYSILLDRCVAAERERDGYRDAFRDALAAVEEFRSERLETVKQKLLGKLRYDDAALLRDLQDELAAIAAAWEEQRKEQPNG